MGVDDRVPDNPVLDIAEMFFTDWLSYQSSSVHTVGDTVGKVFIGHQNQPTVRYTDALSIEMMVIEGDEGVHRSASTYLIQARLPSTGNVYGSPGFESLKYTVSRNAPGRRDFTRYTGWTAEDLLSALIDDTM